MVTYLRRSVCLAACLLLYSFAAQAETVLVAVASNFTKPMSEIAAEFEKQTGYGANLAFGSSGKFASQLLNGAPFEVFLSADDEKPLRLEQEGVALAGSRFTYALGTLVLWSAKPGAVDADGQILHNGSFRHLALADPKLAPYGVAAVEVMNKLKVYDKLQPLLVYGENISQAQEFVSTGNAELGFIALSQVNADGGGIGEGSGWVVPTELHTPIRQDAVLMKAGAQNPAAPALMAFLKSPAALAIIERYGYRLPNGREVVANPPADEKH